MRLSDLLGLEVRSTSGDHLGRVHDVRANLAAGEMRITGLIVGPSGILERLGLGAPRAQIRKRGHHVVLWESVIRADRRGVVVDDDGI
jgi:sporulation protein YlmC with PRC-barrel domain